MVATKVPVTFLRTLDHKDRAKIVDWLVDECDYEVVAPSRPVPRHRVRRRGGGDGGTPEFVWKLATLGTVTRLADAVARHARDKVLASALGEPPLGRGRVKRLQERYLELRDLASLAQQDVLRLVRQAG